jgi:NADH-quinone oxidoreductase subunit G
MGCMTPVRRRPLLLGGDPASDFRKSVIEWLMLNHPHDCPVCGEGASATCRT